MGESPFLAFAEEHDLDYAERVADDAGGKFPLPYGETTELAGGKLPGGREGIVGRLHRGDADGESQEFTLVVTRLPQTVGFARYISCVEAGFAGIVGHAMGPAGLGWTRDFDFESIEFNRRYRVTMLRTGKEGRLRELFSPVFIDWMAETAPEGLYFNLVSGALTVTLAGEPPAGSADLVEACELSGYVADRIEAEASEREGLGDDPEADPALAAAQEPQRDRKRGLLGRLFGGRRKTEEKMLDLVAVLHSFAGANGLEYHQPASLAELLPFIDHFPMPVMRQASLRGALPGTRARGALVALFDFDPARGRGLWCRPAWETTVPLGRGIVHVLPSSNGDPFAAATIGGFSLRLGGGERRETQRAGKAREKAEKLAADLGGSFDVVIDPSSGRAPVPAAAREWLSGDGASAFVVESGKLTLVGEPRKLEEWSQESIGEFADSVAPAVADLDAG